MVRVVLHYGPTSIFILPTHLEIQALKHGNKTDFLMLDPVLNTPEFCILQYTYEADFLVNTKYTPDRGHMVHGKTALLQHHITYILVWIMRIPIWFPLLKISLYYDTVPLTGN